MPPKPLLILAALLLGVESLPDPLLPAKFALLFWYAACGCLGGAAAAVFFTRGTLLREMISRGFVGIACGIAVGAAVLARFGADDAAVFWGICLTITAGFAGPAGIALYLRSRQPQSPKP